MTLDMSKYLGIFLSESTEHLEALGRELVRLEENPRAEVIDSVFRHAHSIKGMSASMGFEEIATLAHRVEDLVHAVRSKPELVNRELVDLLFAAADAMSAQVKEVGSGKPASSAGPIVERVVSALGALKPAATKAGSPVPHEGSAPTPAVERRSEPRAGRLYRWALKIRIAFGCKVPGVRGFLVFKRLSGLGNVFDLRPPMEELKAGRIPEGIISLELETVATDSEVRAQLSNISEVELLEVSPVVEGAFAPSPVAEASTPEVPKVVGQEPARTVRVKAELLDFFLDTAGELLSATARIREIGKNLPEQTRLPLDEGVYRIHGLVKDLHDKVMGARMTPLSVITDRLPRVARDVSRKQGREVELVVTGAEVELDRCIIDDLADPFIHLLRNAVDHGIEPPEERVALGKSPRGRIEIQVKRVKDRVVVQVTDDGRGMDTAKLKGTAVARGLVTREAAARMSDREAFMLACLPGISTSEAVSEISGRGVGMDAVKRTAESVGGTLEIDSDWGKGTRFTLRLPLTVAVVNLLLVEVGSEVFGLPIGKVLGALESSQDALSSSRNRALLTEGDQLLPVHQLDELLELDAPLRSKVRPYVVMEGDRGKVALAVDRLLGQEEVVLKALAQPLDLVPGLSGVTILGSGRPVFVLDVPRLLA